MRNSLTQQAIDYRNSAIGLIDLHSDRDTDPDKLADAITRQSMALRLRLDRLNEAVAEHYAAEVRAYNARCHEMLQQAARLEEEAAAADKAALSTLTHIYGDNAPIVRELAASRNMRPQAAVKLNAQVRALRDQVELLERPIDRPASTNADLTRERVAEMNPERIIQYRAAIYATATK